MIITSIESTAPLNNANQGGPFYFEVKNMNTKKTAHKGPKTFIEQLEILKGRNIIITDDGRAIDALRHINYYRLSGYMLPFKSSEENAYNEGTSLERILRIYDFDHRLRNLLLSLLEHIEISARTSIAYHLAHTHGPLCYEERELFKNPDRHKKSLDAIEKSVQDAREGNEPFVIHHDDRYDGRLPIWSLVEVLSFGTLSKLYANLKDEDKETISKTYFGVPPYYFESWLRNLAYIRNICAHHSRIYHHPLTHQPRLYHDDKMYNGIFAPIFVGGILCPRDSDWFAFRAELESLIEQYEDSIELNHIKFLPNWTDILHQTISDRRLSASRLRERQISRNNEPGKPFEA